MGRFEDQDPTEGRKDRMNELIDEVRYFSLVKERGE